MHQFADEEQVLPAHFVHDDVVLKAQGAGQPVLRVVVRVVVCVVLHVHMLHLCGRRAVR